MKNIIDEIYDNDLFHLTDISKVGKEYTDAMSRLCAAERKMLDKCPDIKETFDEYQDAQIALANLSNRQEFTKGIRIGAQLVLEMIKPIK